MSIREVTMYVAECDRCGARDDEGDYCAWTDVETAEENATDGDWRRIGDRLACPDCSTYDDEGELIEKPLPSRQPVTATEQETTQ